MSNTIKQDIVSGVYMIHNTLNDKKYIGSSVDIYRRFGEHVYLLESNCHHSSHLQHSWDKYGPNAFEFKIVELVNASELLQREQYYLDNFQTYNPNLGYNISSVAGARGASYNSFIYGKQTITYAELLILLDKLQTTDWSFVKIAECIVAKGDKRFKAVHNLVGEIYHRKKYIKITQNMVFQPRVYKKTQMLKQYGEEIKQLIEQGYTNQQIAECLNIDKGMVATLTKQQKWFKPRVKRIAIYNSLGELVAECNGGLEAQQITGVSNNYITRACRNKLKKCQGFHFEYVEE